MYHNIHITGKGRINLAPYETKQAALDGLVLDALNARQLGTVAASIIAFEGSEANAKAAILDKLKNLRK